MEPLLHQSDSRDLRGARQTDAQRAALKEASQRVAGCVQCGREHCVPVGHQREIARLQDALQGVRGVVLGPLGDARKKVELINEIVREALNDDGFEGTLEIAYKNGWTVR